MSVAIVAAMLVVAGSASAAEECDLLVAPGGTDSASGTLDDPLKTVDEVLDRLKPGETGCLRGGTYVDYRFTVSTPDIKLTSFPGERATLRGQLRFDADADGSEVSNMLLDGRNDDDFLGPLIYADGVVLSGNEITNHNTAICVHVDQYPGEAAPRGVIIENNRIHNCGELPANNHEHGIYIASARGTIVRDNLIYDNADRGVQMYPDADDTIVTGNVIDGNGQGVIFGGGTRDSSDNNLVTGNVITNSRIRYNVESHWQGPVGKGNVARDNCVWTQRREYRGTPDGSGIADMRGATATANTVANPGYANRAASDFTLNSDSRCLRTVATAPVDPPPFEPQPGPDSLGEAPDTGDHDSGDSGTESGDRGSAKPGRINAPCSRTRHARQLMRHLIGTERRDRLHGGHRFSAKLVGKRGNDVIRTSRKGSNCILGGAGRDRIRSVNGHRDVIRCGPGRDLAIVDRKDRVKACEHVKRRHGQPR